MGPYNELPNLTHDLSKSKEYYTSTTHDIQIEVVPSYVPERSDPAKNHYFYSYKIRMTNHGKFAHRVIHRHWKIKDGNGKVYEIQSSGVASEQPMLDPGKSYEYISFCPLHSPYGNMRGKYQIIDEFSNRFWIDIPVFFFRKPETFIN